MFEQKESGNSLWMCQPSFGFLSGKVCAALSTKPTETWTMTCLKLQTHKWLYWLLFQLDDGIEIIIQPQNNIITNPSYGGATTFRCIQIHALLKLKSFPNDSFLSKRCGVSAFAHHLITPPPLSFQVIAITVRSSNAFLHARYIHVLKQMGAVICNITQMFQSNVWTPLSSALAFRSNFMSSPT